MGVKNLAYREKYGVRRDLNTPCKLGEKAVDCFM